MTKEMKKIQELLNEFKKIGVIKKGKFKLKSGKISSFYINLRILRSYPKILFKTAKLIKEFLKENNIKPDLLCDVPTSITPVASVLSVLTKIPMISPRLNRKTYGLKNEIDGIFKKGDKVLIIDDVLTTGKSKLEVIEILQKNGLKILGVLVIFDRSKDENAKQKLKQKAHKIYSIYKI